jgi:hypothetical protein
MPILGGPPAVLGTTMTATASGSIADGKPVVINANGTVSQAAAVSGTSLVLLHAVPELIVEYYLDEAFNVSNNGVHYRGGGSIEMHSTGVGGICFNNDGTKLFHTSRTPDAVQEFALSVAYDINTMKYTREFSIASQESDATGVRFNADGTKMFVVGYSGDDVNEYALSSGFDVSTASFTDSFSVSSQESSPNGLAFNTDGTKMFIVGSSGDDVNEYALSTGFDVSTASFTDAFSVVDQTTYPNDICFNTDGTKMFICGIYEMVYQYTLSTGFDVSTASFANTFMFTHDRFNPGVSTTGSAISGLIFGSGCPPPGNYIGIASGAYSDGNTVTIQLIGSIDDAQSGMTAGTLQYVQRDGSIGSRITPVVAGVALTQTKLLVKGGYNNLFHTGMPYGV